MFLSPRLLRGVANYSLIHAGPSNHLPTQLRGWEVGTFLSSCRDLVAPLFLFSVVSFVVLGEGVGGMSEASRDLVLGKHCSPEPHL